jgi:hypothetical protein
VQRNPKHSIAQSTKEAWTRLVNDPLVAYTGDKIALTQRRNKRNACNVVLLQEEYYKSGFGIVIKQGSPYKRHFDITYVDKLFMLSLFGFLMKRK